MTKSNKIKPSERVFRKLEDLNLIDNFLFQQMLQQKEDGEEFARILLSTILGKHIRKVTIISQKNILGIDTDKHGIRLDAYIEDLSDELDSNLADARLIPDLSTEGMFPGTDMNNAAPVPDVYDIEPNNTYEKEVGVNYMKSWEIEEMMRHHGFREGFNDGFNDGNSILIDFQNAVSTYFILSPIKSRVPSLTDTRLFIPVNSLLTPTGYSFVKTAFSSSYLSPVS